jgi:hypothetical protein
MTSRKASRGDRLNPFTDSYYNPFRKPNNPNPWLSPPYSPYLPPKAPQETRPKERKHEYIELDIGSGILWCKLCVRKTCPFFKEGGREKTLSLLKKQTLENGRVVIDIFDPEHRWISGVVLLSQVGCVSFSYLDIQEEPDVKEYDLNPDFLEIL